MLQKFGANWLSRDVSPISSFLYRYQDQSVLGSTCLKQTREFRNSILQADVHILRLINHADMSFCYTFVFSQSYRRWGVNMHEGQQNFCDFWCKSWNGISFPSHVGSIASWVFSSWQLVWHNNCSYSLLSK